MTSSALHRVTRQALVVGATAGVIGGAAVCVDYAATWRAAAAPLDSTPVSAASVGSSLDAQHQRTQALAGEIDQVAAQLGDLHTAILGARSAIADQNNAASSVGGQLASAQAKLTAVQSQLAAAQQRLAQLNAAAAKQAALNAAAAKHSTVIVKKVVTTTGASGSTSSSDD